MSLLAALLMLQTAPPAEPPAAEEEDTRVVLARRLEEIQVSISRDQDGEWYCSLSASSGYAAVDNRLCRSATTCFRSIGENREEMIACMSRSRGNILQEFRRRHARQ